MRWLQRSAGPRATRAGTGQRRLPPLHPRARDPPLRRRHRRFALRARPGLHGPGRPRRASRRSRSGTPASAGSSRRAPARRRRPGDGLPCRNPAEPRRNARPPRLRGGSPSTTSPPSRATWPGRATRPPRDGHGTSRPTLRRAVPAQLCSSPPPLQPPEAGRTASRATIRWWSRSPSWPWPSLLPGGWPPGSPSHPPRPRPTALTSRPERILARQPRQGRAAARQLQAPRHRRPSRPQRQPARHRPPVPPHRPPRGRHRVPRLRLPRRLPPAPKAPRPDSPRCSLERRQPGGRFG